MTPEFRSAVAAAAMLVGWFIVACAVAGFSFGFVVAVAIKTMRWLL